MNNNLELNFQKSKILDGLNDAQAQAVMHKDGPLLIIAGAGTGKTSVITRRIAYIVEQKWALPSEILALTFTEKAAAEMEERVDQLVPYGYTDMWISTFNAFGDRFIRDFSLDIGLTANFKVLSAVEQSIFIKQHLYEFDLVHYRPISSPATHIQSLLTHFSRLKDELIEPENYIAWAKNNLKEILKLNDKDLVIEAEKTLELANAYSKYQELMMQSGSLDYGDQIYLSCKVLRENPSTLKAIREKFKYILVDEFQDTNYAQNELVKLLAGEDGNLTVVGDDDQSIYRFRGASISNILEFKNNFKSMTQIVLNRNYRSSQEILDSSYKLIQHNNPDRLEIRNKIDKKLVANFHGNKPELLHCSTLSCEADLVIKKITELKNEHNYSYKDFAILIRANTQAAPFIQALSIAGIPYIFSGASSLLQQPEIRMIVSFLRLLVNPEDHLSFFHLATSEIYDIDVTYMASYYSELKNSNRGLTDTDSEGVTEESLKELIEDLKYYRSIISTNTAGELLYNFLTQKNILKKWLESKATADEIKIFNVAAFFDRISNFDHVSEDRSVPSFLSALEFIIESGDDTQASEIDSEIDAVNILTAHASKGLEYQAVFVVNLVSDRFPTRRQGSGLLIPNDLIKESLPEVDFHIQEERRLFYVAITRAKKHLFITAADDYGGKRAKKLSPFVLELFDQYDPEVVKHKLSPSEKISRYSKISSSPISPIKSANKQKYLRLSRQQVDDYFTCPQKYYLTHIVKIPLLKNHHLMYGTAIHAALNNHFVRKSRGESSSLDELLSDYKKSFSNIGFITREHEDAQFNQGIETLTSFFKQDQLETTLPTEIESPFEFSDGDVKINGRYDLVFKNEDQNEIRDFKTSKVKDQKDADKRIKDSTQMKIYALAWLDKYGAVPKTTLHFIESELMGERIYSEQELESTRQMIAEVAKGIRTNQFAAKPEKRNCDLCSFNQICPNSLA